MIEAFYDLPICNPRIWLTRGTYKQIPAHKRDLGGVAKIHRFSTIPRVTTSRPLPRSPSLQLIRCVGLITHIA
jgi:hypothetical protein